MNRFGQMWDEYARKVLPQNAGQVQIQETRRAFYAGGVRLFYTMLSMLDSDAEPTEDDLRKMDDLKAEFDAYMRDLAEGKT